MELKPITKVGCSNNMRNFTILLKIQLIINPKRGKLISIMISVKKDVRNI